MTAKAPPGPALQALARDPEIARRASSPARVRLLWDVCQIPDFRKVMSDQHTRLVMGKKPVAVSSGTRRPMSCATHIGAAGKEPETA